MIRDKTQLLEDCAGNRSAAALRMAAQLVEQGFRPLEASYVAAEVFDIDSFAERRRLDRAVQSFSEMEHRQVVGAGL